MKFEVRKKRDEKKLSVGSENFGAFTLMKLSAFRCEQGKFYFGGVSEKKVLN